MVSCYKWFFHLCRNLANFLMGFCHKVDLLLLEFRQNKHL
uniref:Uncharacterized protein n=1 Tax=Myoviridae sp. ctCo31 TaxID=2825053 RepID=A0A8S5UMF1_9CAUD|nr:MAG TPA: hypothetical protein [Myoviridae sp. ctCo31]